MYAPGTHVIRIVQKRAPGKTAFVKVALVDQNVHANARLIAAAPDLLERLKEACDLIAELSHDANNNGAMIDEEEFVAGRAAIAKATGADQ